MWDKVQETVKFLKEKGIDNPAYGIILGTGLGNLANEIKAHLRISYEEIPHFPVSTVKGHHGELIFGEFSPAGKLPIEIPSSVEAVEKQLEDVPFDSHDPLYPFGFGLSYD